MMRVTFLAHSGFLVETESRCVLFDWWKGPLPPLPDKPLSVFVSHRHEDHFNPRIFTLDDGTRDVIFVLSKDIKLSARNREKWGVCDSTAEKCLSVGAAETLSLPSVGVETLRSTDEGVAFVVCCDGKTIYHAGDLNWWHWEGEDKAWNRNMESEFKRCVEPLRRRHIDLAMLPLDPRQEDAYDWGVCYLLELAEIDRVLPMHQWGEFSATARCKTAHPEFADKILDITGDGQVFNLND